MRQKECVAMVLARGDDERLGALTNDVAKPTVYFGGKYRIIDFTLSNCTHSGIDTLGVLTQYRALELRGYINSGETWHLDKTDGGVTLLPSNNNGGLYKGTANAVYQNIAFIEQFQPENVLILSGDHVYKMDYRKMLNSHKIAGADATIAVVPMPFKEASKFGIMNTSENGFITEFDEKPKKPKSNLASMGIYIFTWSRLKEYLIADKDNIRSQNDFGRNIIPAMLSAGEKLYAYQFDSYWRDVGSIQSLWESNMDLISDPPKLDLHDEKWEIFTRIQPRPPCCISGKADVKRSIIAEGCSVYGKVENAVLSDSVTVSEGAEVIDSIVMRGAFIGKNAKIYKSIIGANAYTGENVEIGAEDGLDVFFDNEICSKDISLIGPGIRVDGPVRIRKNSHVGNSLLLEARQAVAANNCHMSKNIKDVCVSMGGQTTYPNVI